MAHNTNTSSSSIRPPDPQYTERLLPPTNYHAVRAAEQRARSHHAHASSSAAAAAAAMPSSADECEDEEEDDSRTYDDRPPARAADAVAAPASAPAAASAAVAPDAHATMHAENIAPSRTVFHHSMHAGWQCSVCHDLPRRPVNLACGHVLCAPCCVQMAGDCSRLKKHATVPVRCPECRTHTDIDPRKPLLNHFLKRQIETLGVKCTHAHCSTSFMLGPDFAGLTKHEQERCRYRLVKCEDCGASMTAMESANHTDACPQFKYQCPRCKELFTADELQCHDSLMEDDRYRSTGTCSGSVLCPNRCLIEGNEQPASAAAAAAATDLQVTCVPKSQLAQHLSMHCPLRIVQCPLAGCSKDVRASQLKAHKRKFFHVELLSNALKRQRSAPAHPFGPGFGRISNDVARLSRNLSHSAPIVVDVHHPDVEKIKVEYRSTNRGGGDIWVQIFYRNTADAVFGGGTFGLQVRLCRRANAQTLDQMEGADLTHGTELAIFTMRYNAQIACRNTPVAVFPSTDITQLHGHETVDPEGNIMIFVELFRLPTPNELAAAAGAADAAREIVEVD